jgi:formylglycine-generating enzyme required for sulfatase activity
MTCSRERVEAFAACSRSEIRDAQRPTCSACCGDAGRVRRGGSWFNLSSHYRSAIRDRLMPVDRYYYLGFRVVRSSIK